MRGLSRNNHFIARLLERFKGATPEVGPLVRGATIHVIILDGTMSTLEKGCETNAGLTYKLLSETGSKVSLYYEHGVQWSQWRGVGDVIVGRGINRQIRRAYGYLASRYHPGDRIMLFGFSRGAYAVCSLAGVIERIGLLHREKAIERYIRDAYRYYKAVTPTKASRAFSKAHCHDKIQIEMIGAWDTVKALGLNLPVLRRFSAAKHDFHKHVFGPSVKNAYHALARHETRAIYEPVMWSTDEGWTGHMEQMWFRGAHGDVGGEISGRQFARPLSNIPLVWMLEKAEKHGLPLPEGWQERFPQDPTAPATGTWRGYGRLLLWRKQRQVGLDASERVHPSIAIARAAPKPAPQWWGWGRQSTL